MRIDNPRKVHFDWLPTPGNDVADLNRVASLAWTDLDFSAIIGARRCWVVLDLYLHLDAWVAGAGYAAVRRNGDTPATQQRTWVRNAPETALDNSNTVILETDGNGVIEYSITLGANLQLDTYISLLGFAYEVE